MHLKFHHDSDIIMTTMASQFTSLKIVYSIVYSDAEQRKHQSSASLAFLRGIHRESVNSPHKGPVTRKMFPFDDVIMLNILSILLSNLLAFINTHCVLIKCNRNDKICIDWTHIYPSVFPRCIFFSQDTCICVLYINFTQRRSILKIDFSFSFWITESCGKSMQGRGNISAKNIQIYME